MLIYYSRSARAYARWLIFFGALFNCFIGLSQQPSSEPIFVKNIKSKRQKFEISGYVQPQYQWGEKSAELRVGAANGHPQSAYNRFGVRRGRIRLFYEYGIVSGVFQPDITEKGFKFRDVFLRLKAPFLGMSSFKIGVFNRPFGHEIAYSSAMRESPERATIFRTLFPDERDVGLQLSFMPAKTSVWNFFKLEAGLFFGNGVQCETDSYKDFIGHLSINKLFEHNIKLGLGLSYYNGGVYQGSENLYTMNADGFVLDNSSSNKSQFAKREYIGLDGQLSISTGIGLTQLRAEYLLGTQPGTKSSSKSPNLPELPNTDTYIRNLSGGYVILVQGVGKLPFSGVIKYDWYDPNTSISKNQIGLNRTGKGDIAYNTFGFGFIWRASNSVRVQSYYEINKNEVTEYHPAYVDDIKDDAFTLRIQYQF